MAAAAARPPGTAFDAAALAALRMRQRRDRSQRLHVALIVERFEPGGGVEGVAWQLAHGLARAGDRVSVVGRRAVASEAVEFVPVDAPPQWQALRVWRFAERASRAAYATGAELVHSFSRTRRQDLYRAGGGSHADYMARSYSSAGRRLRALSPRHRVLLHIEAGVFGDPRQRIQCNSRWVRDALVTRHGVDPERTVVTYNGVDLERFRPERRAAARDVLRRAHDAPDGARVWLFAGHGFRRKGLDTALETLARSRGPASQLWVAGADATPAWAQRARTLGVEERVRFLGPRDDLPDLFAAADGLLLPTRYDAFANVCLEAAASGCPVWTSASNGAAEILGEGGCVIRDAEDAAGFAAALDRCDDDTLSAMGRTARRVAERYGWEHHIEAQRALYREIAA